MKTKSFQYYIDRYHQGTITVDEWKALKQLVEDTANETAIYALMDKQLDGLSLDVDEFPAVTERIVNAIQAKIEQESVKSRSTTHRVHFLKTTWFRYAAAIIVLLGTGAYLWTISPGNDPSLSKARNKKVQVDVEPGKDGAILTLADGTQVVLDSIGNGVVTNQNGTRVVLNNGLLAYDITSSSSAKMSYNSITTPKGRQFQLVLPDGSKVWLNAASYIRYPTVFVDDERVVEINGEAHFKIAKNRSKPFKVKVNDAAVIEVLGTSFNVNSYENEEAIKTTLVEGSVRINAYNHLQALKPGQQAQIYPNETIHVVDGIDVNQVVAWKNGYFDFNKSDLQVMMRQLERWYDIAVTYKGDPPNMVFKGKMDRDMQLSDVIRFLTASGIKTNLEGRTLIISGS